MLPPGCVRVWSTPCWVWLKENTKGNRCRCGAPETKKSPAEAEFLPPPEEVREEAIDGSAWRADGQGGHGGRQGAGGGQQLRLHRGPPQELHAARGQVVDAALDGDGGGRRGWMDGSGERGGGDLAQSRPFFR